MNLAQSPTLPPPRNFAWSIPTAPPPAEPLPEPPGHGTYKRKVLNYLAKRVGFGKAQAGATFPEIAAALGHEDTLGASLHRLRQKGLVTSTGGLAKTCYQITELGQKVLE